MAAIMTALKLKITLSLGLRPVKQIVALHNGLRFS